jgi:hypothetical protein
MDIFSGNAFSMVTLTAALNEVPHMPGRLGQMGLFEESGVATTRVAIENQANTLALVPTSPRGAPPTQNTPDKRTIQNLDVVRLAMSDNIMADEVQGIRSFGSMSDVQTLQGEVQRRNARMARLFEITLEHMRIGAIKGIVVDSDGSTPLYNLFTIFNVSQQAEVDFNLQSTLSEGGALRTLCSGVIRTIEDELGGLPYSTIHAMCSSQFFDDLIANGEVRESFVHSEGFRLRERTARREIFFGGIMWEEYRGKIGAIDYIADDKVHIFPTGVPGNFTTNFGPADYNDTVNTIGLPLYARNFPDPKGRFQELEVQSNPLTICTRPRTLVQGTRLAP